MRYSLWERLHESNSVIDAGQYTLQTANPSQGTAPYVSYQWYTISGSTAPTCTVSNAISGATSSTYLANPATTNSYAYEVSDSASTANTACSSGDTATVDTVPTVTITAQNTIVDAGQIRIILRDPIRRFRNLRDLQLHSVQLNFQHGARKPVVLIIDILIPDKFTMDNKLTDTGERDSHGHRNDNPLRNSTARNSQHQ